eukprot:scaffold57086_cov59-Phaeocystis_antarctica.AAC.5
MARRRLRIDDAAAYARDARHHITAVIRRAKPDVIRAGAASVVPRLLHADVREHVLVVAGEAFHVGARRGHDKEVGVLRVACERVPVREEHR